MSLLPDLWSLLFGAMALALLAWPFYPAWREWREPSDDQPLPVRDAPQPWHGAAGAIPAGEGAQSPPETDTLNHRPSQRLLLDLPHAQPWGDLGWRVQGDCHLPEDCRLPGPLVVTGTLRCGARSLLEGDVKVHGDAHLGPDSTLQGALFAHNVTLAQRARVLGPVVARAQVNLGPRSTIGQREQPTSLSAERVQADGSARVFGTVWTAAKAPAP